MSDNSEIISPPGEQDLSPLAKIAGVFLDPKRTFNSLNRKPDFIVPLIIVMLTATLFTLTAWPVIEQYAVEQQIERMTESGATPEQIEQAMKIGHIVGVVSQPVWILLSSLVVAGVLLFAGNIVIGGESNYKKMLSVYCYSSLIGVIAYAVKLVLMLSKNTMEVYTSPAAMFPASANDTVIFKIAAIFDIFAIWQVVIIAIGMGVIFKASFQKSISLVGTLYVIYAAISIALGGGKGFGG